MGKYLLGVLTGVIIAWVFISAYPTEGETPENYAVWVCDEKVCNKVK